MRADVRAAVLALLDGYKAANNGALRHTFHARPASISPPAAFVDSIDEPEITTWGSHNIQRVPIVRVRLVRGSFSSGDVAEATDAIVDGFINHVRDNTHAAGPSTNIWVSAAEDDDGWIPEWIETPVGSEPRAYYSTIVTLTAEGMFGGFGN